jgi:TolA-binding protein
LCFLYGFLKQGKLKRLNGRHGAAQKPLQVSVHAAGVFGAVLTSQRAVSIATAIVGFCCSTIGLVAQYLEDFSGGNGNSLRGLREQLGQIAFEIAETEGEFQLLIAQNSFDNNLVSLVQRANTLVARLRQAEVLAGLDID